MTHVFEQSLMSLVVYVQFYVFLSDDGLAGSDRGSGGGAGHSATAVQQMAASILEKERRLRSLSDTFDRTLVV